MKHFFVYIHINWDVFWAMIETIRDNKERNQNVAIFISGRNANEHILYRGLLINCGGAGRLN